MLCSRCHKNEAVICYTEIVNGIKKEQYLCPECAAKYTAFDTENSAMTPGSLLAGLLTSVLGQAGVSREDDSKKTNLVCPTCGMTYNEFLKYSRFGCADCVHTFGFLLDDYLKKIQGSCEHSGKKYSGRETVVIPWLDMSDIQNMNDASEKKIRESAEKKQSGHISQAIPAAAVSDGDSPEITELKQQLAAAIKAEEYERAAHIRDAIRALKTGAAEGADGAKNMDTPDSVNGKEAQIDEKLV